MGLRFSRTDPLPPYGFTKIKPSPSSGTEANNELARILTSDRMRRSTAAMMAASKKPNG
jgi:hypothetical protein